MLKSPFGIIFSKQLRWSFEDRIVRGRYNDSGYRNDGRQTPVLSVVVQLHASTHVIHA